jgi:hypothetical protein
MGRNIDSLKTRNTLFDDGIFHMYDWDIQKGLLQIFSTQVTGLFLPHSKITAKNNKKLKLDYLSRATIS